MKYTIFLGCNIPARVQQYQTAAEAVWDQLKIDLIQMKDFLCCGYPMRSIDEFTFLVSAAKNIALAEQNKNDLMVLCKCCYGSLKIAQHQLNNNINLKERVNNILKKENLSYTGKINIKHFLSVLHDDIGIKSLKAQIKSPYKNLKIAASVGCHALRPAKITEFDSPTAPSIFDTLVKATGATPIDWSKKSDCCGAPLLGINDDLSHKIMETKLQNALKNKAMFISVACPYSFIQFDSIQSQLLKTNKDWNHLAPVLYPQLLGLAMGIPANKLGINLNLINIDSHTTYISDETPLDKNKKKVKKTKDKNTMKDKKTNNTGDKNA